MKKRYLSLALLCMWCLSLLGQNISTGINGAGFALPLTALDPAWQTVSSPYSGFAARRCATFGGFWEPTPVAGTNACWINYTGNNASNLAGFYTFERPFTIPSGTASFTLNFKVACDDSFVGVWLVDPTGATMPFTWTPTTWYHLGSLITHTQTSPMPGTWRIRAKCHFIDAVAAFLLSGDLKVKPCGPTLPASLTPGLVAYYPFNGGSLLDHWGPHHLFNATGIPVPTTDRTGSPNCAYEFFGGTADYLQSIMPLPAGIIPVGSPWSVSLWCKPLNTTPGDFEMLFSRGGPPLTCPDGMGEISVALYDCRKPVMRCDQYSCWDFSVSTMIPSCTGQISQYIADGWEHIVAIYNPAAPPSTRYTIYRNGIATNTSFWTCGSFYADMGALWMGLGFTGSLDDVLLYNVPLLPSQVSALMGLPSSCCSPNGPRMSAPDPMASSLQIAPNPNTGRFQLLVPDALGDGPATVDVFDLQGKLQHSVHITLRGAATHHFDLGDQPAGVYVLRLRTATASYHARFVKE